MNSDFIKLSWNSTEYNPLPVGAYVMYGGVKYRLFEEYQPTQTGEASWKYEPQFQHPTMWLKYVPYLHLQGNVSSWASADKKSDWTYSGYVGNLVADLLAFMKLWGQNVGGEFYETFFGSGSSAVEYWEAEIDTVLVNTVINITFTATDIWSAMASIAGQLDCEFHFDLVEHKLHVGTVSYRRGEETAAIPLNVGVNVGAPSISRNKEAYCNRYVVYGGTRNMTQQGIDGKGYQAVNRLSLPSNFEGSVIDLRSNSTPSTDISQEDWNAIKAGVNEPAITGELDFDDIFPQVKFYIYDVQERLRRRKYENDEVSDVTYATWYTKLAVRNGDSFTGYKLTDYVFAAVSSKSVNSYQQNIAVLNMNFGGQFTGSKIRPGFDEKEYGMYFVTLKINNSNLVAEHVQVAPNTGDGKTRCIFGNSHSEFYQSLSVGTTVIFLEGVDSSRAPKENIDTDRIAGVELQASFLPNYESGALPTPLAGRTFSVVTFNHSGTEHDNEDVSQQGAEFDDETFRIEFVEENTLIIPQKSNEPLTLKYDTSADPETWKNNIISLIGIKAPAEAVTAAKTELLNAAVAAIKRKRLNNNTYTLKSYPHNWSEHLPTGTTPLHLGMHVILMNSGGNEFLDTHVRKLVTRLDFPEVQEITVGNEKRKGTIATLKEKVETTVFYGGSSSSSGNGTGNAQTSETANKATRLADNTPHTVWGQTYWENGKPKDVDGDMIVHGGISFGETGKGISEDGDAVLGDVGADKVTVSKTVEDETIETIIEPDKVTTPEIETPIIGTENFNGALIGGSGWRIWLEEGGASHMVIDQLEVRLKAYFAELEIRRLSYSGGNLVFSAAASKIEEVIPVDAGGNPLSSDNPNYDSLLYGYKCYFVSDDGTTATVNDWRVGDQARCQTFNIDSGKHTGVSNRYYWRKVLEAESDNGATSDEGKKRNWVVLAAKVFFSTLYNKGMQTGVTNDIPQAGDTIVQLGNQNTATFGDRQNAISLETNSTTAPAIYKYQGIDDFTLDGKMVQADFYDSASHAYKSVTYGDWYVGAKPTNNADPFTNNADTYVRYRQNVDGSPLLEIKAKIEATSGSPILNTINSKAQVYTNTVGTMSSVAYKAGDLWILPEAVGNYAAGTVLIAKSDKGSSFSLTDWKAVEETDFYAYVQQIVGGSIVDTNPTNSQQAANKFNAIKAALNDGTTTINGGLVLTNLIALKNGTGGVTAGITGQQSGNDIALWLGGPMADSENPQTGQSSFAKSLFRFDGSGYLAGGNIKWDTLGNTDVRGTIRAKNLFHNVCVFIETYGRDNYEHVGNEDVFHFDTPKHHVNGDVINNVADADVVYMIPQRNDPWHKSATSAQDQNVAPEYYLDARTLTLPSPEEYEGKVIEVFIITTNDDEESTGGAGKQKQIKIRSISITDGILTEWPVVVAIGSNDSGELITLQEGDNKYISKDPTIGYLRLYATYCKDTTGNGRYAWIYSAGMGGNNITNIYGDVTYSEGASEEWVKQVLVQGLDDNASLITTLPYKPFLQKGDNISLLTNNVPYLVSSDLQPYALTSALNSYLRLSGADVMTGNLKLGEGTAVKANDKDTDLLAYKNISWGGVTGEHWFVGAAGVNGFIRSYGELKRWKDANTQYTIWDESNLNLSAWAKAANKPTYNLDEVADGTTRKLSNYATTAALATVEDNSVIDVWFNSQTENLIVKWGTGDQAPVTLPYLKAVDVSLVVGSSSNADKIGLTKNNSTTWITVPFASEADYLRMYNYGSDADVANGLSGTLAFYGTNLLAADGYDYAALQVGYSQDKWQITALSGHLYIRENDTPNGSGEWTSWRKIVDEGNISSYLSGYASASAVLDIQDNAVYSVAASSDSGHTNQLKITKGDNSSTYITVPYATKAGNSDKLGTYEPSHFATASALNDAVTAMQTLASVVNNKVSKAGDTMSGNLVMNGNGIALVPNLNYPNIYYQNGQIIILGPAVHVQTDGQFLFNGAQVATESWVGQQGYLTQHQSLDGLVPKSWKPALLSHYSAGGAVGISSGVDLNDFETSGTYYCQSAAVAGTLANCPYKDGNFRLFVLVNTGTEGRGNSWWGTQILVTGNGLNAIYTRGHSGTSWTTWRRANPIIRNTLNNSAEVPLVENLCLPLSIGTGTGTGYASLDLSAYATTSAMNTALSGYLPLTAGADKALTGQLYLDTGSTTEVYVNVKSNRATANGGGWAFPLITARNAAGTSVFSLGAYGAAAALNYAYIGAGAWNAANNLRVYTDGSISLGNSIKFQGSASIHEMIKFIDSGLAEGSGIAIGGGGATIIGGGESAVTMSLQVSGQNERMYIGNDGAVSIFTNLQSGWDYRKEFTFGTNGNLTMAGTLSSASLSAKHTSGETLVLDSTAAYTCAQYKVGGTEKWSVGANSTSFYFWSNNGSTTRMSILENGNVGIGTTSPAQKLDVNGNTKINGSLAVSSYVQQGFSSGTYYFMQTASTKDTNFKFDFEGNLSAYSLNVGLMRISENAAHTDITFASTTSTAIRSYNFDGSVYAKGTLLASDINMKDVSSYIEPNVREIAAAPIIEFSWKDDASKEKQLGSIAQYWEKILPQAVKTAPNGMLSMNYDAIALTAGITAARHSLDNERKIAELELRVAELESHLNEITNNNNN